MNFDFLSSNMAGGDAYAVPNTFSDKMGTFGSVISNGANDFFSDPNNIRMLGETGAAISGKGSIGAAIGQGASGLVRNRQLQKASADQVKQNDNLGTKLLEAARQGKLLSPTDQNDKFDNMTIDGDGNVSLKMKNTPPAVKASLTDLPAEADKGLSKERGVVNQSALADDGYQRRDGAFDLLPFFKASPR